MARKKKQKQNEDKGQKVSEPIQSQPSLLSSLEKSWFVLAGILLVTLIIRMKFLSIPFERDEGTYTYFGQLVLDGKIPYVDFYEMKLPGIYYCYALLLAIFGHTLEAMHTGFMIINLVSIYFMFRAGSLLFNKTTGLVVAAAFSVLSMNPHVSGFTTQSEHLVAFFLSAGLVVLLKGIKEESWKHYLFAGMLMFASMAVKQNGVFFVLFGGLAIVGHYLMNKGMDWKNMFINGLIYTGGVLIPLTLIVGIIAAQGAFDEFVYWIYEHPKAYVGGIEWDPQGKQLLGIAWSNITRNYYLLFMLGIAGMVFTAFANLSWHKKAMIWTFGILGFASVTPGLRFYGHYWLYFMPAVAIAIGAAVYGLQSLIAKKASEKIAMYAAIAVFGIALVHHIQKVQSDTLIKDYYTGPNPMNVLRKVYGQNPFPESKIVGDWIKKNSAEDDKIAVLGSEPQIYFYANRRGVSRHNYCGYLVKDTPHHAEWQKEFIADVEAAMPKYLIYFRHPVSWLAQPNTDRTIFTWFDPFANKNYDLIGMTQVLSENQLAHKWGKQEASQLMQDMRKQENALRQKLQAAQQAGNQQQVNNLRNQMQIFNFEIIVFQRKENVKSSQPQ